MITVQQRNQQVLQLLQEGVSRRELARKFNLSVSRIAFIRKEFEDEEALKARRVRVREELRNTDDPDKKWAVADLIDALDLKAVFRMRVFIKLT